MRDLDNCEAGLRRDLFTPVCWSHQHHSRNACFPTAAVFLTLITPGGHDSARRAVPLLGSLDFSFSASSLCLFVPTVLWVVYLLFFGPFSNAYLTILYVVLLTYDFRLLSNQMGRNLEIMQSLILQLSTRLRVVLWDPRSKLVYGRGRTRNQIPDLI